MIDAAELMPLISRLHAMLRECADDLECEIEGRYDGVKDHPAMKRRYERDMDSVNRARVLLDETGIQPTTRK